MEACPKNVIELMKRLLVRNFDFNEHFSRLAVLAAQVRTLFLPQKFEFFFQARHLFWLNSGEKEVWSSCSIKSSCKWVDMEVLPDS